MIFANHICCYLLQFTSSFSKRAQKSGNLIESYIFLKYLLFSLNFWISGRDGFEGGIIYARKESSRSNDQGFSSETKLLGHRFSHDLGVEFLSDITHSGYAVGQLLTPWISEDPHKCNISFAKCATRLRRRWGGAPRSRLAGAGFKPPKAALVKSQGSERLGKVTA